MAYAFNVSDPVIEVHNGRRHVAYVVTESDVAVDSEYELDVPKFWTMTLFEAELTDAGAATEIDPELGLDDGFTLGTLDQVVTNETAGTHVRSETDVRVTSPLERLVGRSKPDATATEIVTRLSFVAGHI